MQLIKKVDRCSNEGQELKGEKKGFCFLPVCSPVIAHEGHCHCIGLYGAVQSFSVHFTVQLPAIILSVTSSLTKNIFTFSHFYVCVLIFCFYIYSILFLLSNL